MSELSTKLPRGIVWTVICSEFLKFSFYKLCGYSKHRTEMISRSELEELNCLLG